MKNLFGRQQQLEIQQSRIQRIRDKSLKSLKARLGAYSGLEPCRLCSEKASCISGGLLEKDVLVEDVTSKELVRFFAAERFSRKG